MHIQISYFTAYQYINMVISVSFHYFYSLSPISMDSLIQQIICIYMYNILFAKHTAVSYSKGHLSVYINMYVSLCVCVSLSLSLSLCVCVCVCEHCQLCKCTLINVHYNYQYYNYIITHVM